MESSRPDSTRKNAYRFGSMTQISSDRWTALPTTSRWPSGKHGERVVESGEAHAVEASRRAVAQRDDADLGVAVGADGEVGDLAAVGPPDRPSAFLRELTLAAAVGANDEDPSVVAAIAGKRDRRAVGRPSRQRSARRRQAACRHRYRRTRCRCVRHRRRRGQTPGACRRARDRRTFRPRHCRRATARRPVRRLAAHGQRGAGRSRCGRRATTHRARNAGTLRPLRRRSVVAPFRQALPIVQMCQEPSTSPRLKAISLPSGETAGPQMKGVWVSERAGRALLQIVNDRGCSASAS